MLNATYFFCITLQPTWCSYVHKKHLSSELITKNLSKKTVVMSQKTHMVSFVTCASRFSLRYLYSGILLGLSHAVNTASTHVDDDTRKQLVVVLGHVATGWKTTFYFTLFCRMTKVH